jgi:hypothetical protein
MSGILHTLWTAAGLIGAGCVVLVLALVFAGLVTALIKQIKGGGENERK